MKQMHLDWIEDSKKPIFFCSFGKDSSVVLHGIMPWIEKIMVVFVDCGGTFPDIVEWAKKEGAKMPHFMIVNGPGNIWDDIAAKGWSVDVEIADLGRHSNLMMREDVARRHKVRPWTECTMERFWIPAYAFSEMYRPDLFISGEKAMDRPYATDWGNRTHGAPRAIRPIFDWTDEEVWEYIDYHGIQLPKTFQERQPDRRDCFLCFGHGLTVGRVRYLRENYPELFEKIFYERGFAEVVPVMVRQLTEIRAVWAEVEKMLEEPWQH